jgi:hypothetical protein
MLSMKKTASYALFIGSFVLFHVACSKDEILKFQGKNAFANAWDSIPHDSIPHDSVPHGCDPADTIPHDSIPYPHDTINVPPDTFPYPPIPTDTFPFPPDTSYYPQPPYPPIDSVPHPHDTLRGYNAQVNRLISTAMTFPDAKV